MSNDSPAERSALPSLDRLLDLAGEEEASDLLLQEGEPPRLRVGGRMLSPDLEPLGSGEVVELLEGVIPNDAARRFEELGSADFSLERDQERWRVALFQQRGAAGANFRRIPLEVPTIDDWGLPEVMKEVYDLSEGLVLVTGAAGAGKSSTIAALARGIVERRAVHVVTIEDPIEYLLPQGEGVVTQREVGVDVPDFAEGLRSALRQQPDVLVVGEIRDRETADTALNAAETGSLVLSTLHTRSAPESLGRLLEMFPDAEKKRVVGQVSRVLKAIFTQMLVQRADGEGQIAAVEILRASPPVQQRLAEGDISGLAEEIQSSVSYHRMQSMNQSLAALVLRGVVEREEALRRSPSPDDLDLLLRQSELHASPEDPMAESFSDYSKIHQLQEIKEAHEQEVERHKEAEKRLRERIEEMREAIEERDAIIQKERGILRGLREEWKEKREAIEEMREELDRSVGRLQNQASRLRQKVEAQKRPWYRRWF